MKGKVKAGDNNFQLFSHLFICMTYRFLALFCKKKIFYFLFFYFFLIVHVFADPFTNVSMGFLVVMDYDDI